jgi:hypothetical protein
MRPLLVLLCILILYLPSKSSMLYAFKSDHQIQPEAYIQKLGDPMRNTSKINSPYNRVEIEDMPSEIELTDEEKKYLVNIFLSLNNIITENSRLENEERRILGEGKYFWPKNPETPTRLIKSYNPGNFRMTGIALTVKRKSKDSTWDTIQLTAFPRNFPHGAYLLSFHDEILKYYDAKKTVSETRINEQIESPTVYYFANKKNPGIIMKIYSQDKAPSNLPRRFYAIELKKGDDL